MLSAAETFTECGGLQAVPRCVVGEHSTKLVKVADDFRTTRNGRPPRCGLTYAPPLPSRITLMSPLQPAHTLVHRPHLRTLCQLSTTSPNRIRLPIIPHRFRRARHQKLGETTRELQNMSEVHCGLLYGDEAATRGREVAWRVMGVT